MVQEECHLKHTSNGRPKTTGLPKWHTFSLICLHMILILTPELDFLVCGECRLLWPNNFCNFTPSRGLKMTENTYLVFRRIMFQLTRPANWNIVVRNYICLGNYVADYTTFFLLGMTTWLIPILVFPVNLYGFGMYELFKLSDIIFHIAMFNIQDKSGIWDVQYSG